VGRSRRGESATRGERINPTSHVYRARRLGRQPEPREHRRVVDAARVGVRLPGRSALRSGPPRAARRDTRRTRNVNRDSDTPRPRPQCPRRSLTWGRRCRGVASVGDRRRAVRGRRQRRARNRNEGGGCSPSAPSRRVPSPHRGACLRRARLWLWATRPTSARAATGRHARKAVHRRPCRLIVGFPRGGGAINGAAGVASGSPRPPSAPRQLQTEALLTARRI